MRARYHRLRHFISYLKELVTTRWYGSICTTNNLAIPAGLPLERLPDVLTLPQFGFLSLLVEGVFFSILSFLLPDIFISNFQEAHNALCSAAIPVRYLKNCARQAKRFTYTHNQEMYMKLIGR